MHNLSREEKKKLSLHLSLALGLLFFIGLLVGIVGFLFHKAELILLGGFVCIFPLLYLMITSYQEQVKINNKLRQPVLSDLEEIKRVFKDAEIFLGSFHLDGKENLLNTSKRDAINHLSLERLVETLKERIEDVEKLVNSNNTDKIIDGIKLLESPLCFPPKNTHVLIGHEMPDMHKNSWIDSIKFLKKELEKLSSPL